MNMPVDGPAAGLPPGDPEVRPTGGPAGPAEDHLREVALFVALHLGRAPGVLWPEHDHPLVGDEAEDAEDTADDAVGPDVELLAAQIAAATGLVARPAPVGVPHGHLLVHQMAGATTWSVVGSGEDGRDASLRYRLRAGEVLYVPDGWARTAEPTPVARWTVVVLHPDGPERPATD
ncbi:MULTISPECIES: hypothetical protein [unclassified Streptomyces]|uniref:hypothetical protein n=1 Tax=unclassified Streptomyces TaxID=2593676 RepID=UPI0033BC3B96